MRSQVFTALLLLAFTKGLDADTCDSCTSTYETARDTGGATDTDKCSALKTYLTCLETSSGAGCPLITAKANQIGSDFTGISGSCTLTDPCTCQKTYWGTDITADNNVKCTAAKARTSCLRGKSGMACDASSTVAALGTTTGNIITAVSGCTLADSCNCELNYVKADISANKKCTETKKFISCLKGKTGNDCQGTKTVATLATEGEAVITGLASACTIANTDACMCEIDWAKADISDSKKCTEVKKYIACLKGKTGTGCDGTTTVSQLAAAAETYAGGLTSCAFTGMVCGCDLNFAKADMSDNAKKCIAHKDYISCLLGKTGTGCDGTSSLITLATHSKDVIAAIGSTCTKTSVCDCEIAYAMAVISDDPKECTETKALTTCIQLSIEGGCGSSTTKTNVGTVAQTAFTALSATNCPLTATCQCQVDFNKASVTNTDKCTSANTLVTCLNAITSTTEQGCDGTVVTADLKTNVTSTVQAVLCSSAGLKASIVVSLLMMLMSVLVTSP